MSDSWKIHCLEEEIKKNKKALHDWCGAAIYELELVAASVGREGITLDYSNSYRLDIAAGAVEDAQKHASRIEAASKGMAEIKANPTGAVKL